MCSCTNKEQWKVTGKKSSEITLSQTCDLPGFHQKSGGEKKQAFVDLHDLDKNASR